MTLPPEERIGELVRRGELAGAFFLHGEAARLRDEAARRLAEAAVDPETRDFDLDVFRGDEVEPEELASALAMPPMMGSRRAVLVLDAQELGPAGREAVRERLDHVPPDLVLVVTARIPDGSRAALYRELKEKARSFEWSAPGERELPGWLMERAESRHGFRLAPDAAQAMAVAVGADLGILEAELEKLAGRAEEGVVGREAVEELVAEVREVDRWGWLDRVAAREYEDALRVVPRLLADSSETAVGLLIGMVDQHLYLGVALAGGEGAVREALGRAGKPYLRWKARVYAEQSRKWTPGELRRALRLMRKADGAVKSGISDRRALEELLLSLRLLRREAAA